MKNMYGRKFLVLAACIMLALFGMMQMAYADTEGDFTYTVTDGNAILNGYTGTATAVEVPAALGGYPVTAIGDQAFSGCTGLNEVTLPQTVTQLGENVFAFSANLKSITLPDNVAVSAATFSDCSAQLRVNRHSKTALAVSRAGYAFVDPEYPDFSLYAYTLSDTANQLEIAACLNPAIETLVVPGDISIIGPQAFENCTALTSAEIPETVRDVYENAFANTGLSSVTLYEKTMLHRQAFDNDVAVTCGDYVYTIDGTESNVIAWNGTEASLTVPIELNTLIVTGFGDAVFKNKTFLTDVTLPSATRELGQQLFYGCTALTRADLGDEAEILSAQIFYGCRGLTDVTLPDALTKVDRYAFGNCVVLSSVQMPAGVTEIGVNAFRACAALVEAPLPASLHTIDSYAFYGCNSLTAVNIPDGVTYLGTNVFSGCSALADVTLGKGMTSISSTTFAGLQSLKNLTINGSDVHIASQAFQNCTALQTVTIKDANIDSDAFINCTGLRTFRMDAGSFNSPAFSGCMLLETLYLGSGVDYLPNGAFQNLPALKTVECYASVAALPSEIFRNCTSLTDVYLKPALMTIGTYAFDGCTSLQEISLPSKLELIDNYAFSGCTNLTTVTMQSKLTEIHSYAFSGCGKLTGVVFPDHLEHIGDNAFAGCTALNAVSLPSTVNVVGKDAFPAIVRVYCDPTSQAAVSISANGGSFVSPDSEMFGIRLLLDDGISLGLSVEQIWTEESAVEIPEYIGGETVTELGKNVFASCPGVSQVTLPASVPVLPEAMLKGNQTLTGVIIPEGVTGIGASAFEDCSKLTSISIPSTVTSIGANAFKGCELLKEAQLSDHIQEIGADAFPCTKVFCSLDSDTARMLSRTGGGFVSKEYPLLKMKYLFVGGEAVSLEVVGAESSAATLTVPEQVTSIGEEAFQNMKALTQITLPDSLTAIGSYAFDGTGITAITLPSKVKEIAPCTFRNTTALKNVTIQGTVETVGEYAFSGSGLTKIAFADGLKTVDQFAFSDTAFLKEALLPDSVTEMGLRAFYNSGLVSFAVPKGMTYIPQGCFDDCTVLESVTIPDGVEEIEPEAFSNSGLASIELPASVKNIAGYAFRNCVGLKKAVLPETMESIHAHVFSDCINLTEVVMPKTLETLGSTTFSGCRSLKTIALPAGLTEVQDSTFDGCNSLEQVSLPEGLLKIGNNVFPYCSALTAVSLPSTLVEIGDHVFYGAGLTSLVVPEGVVSIGEFAFYGNPLTTVVLPDTLTSLGTGAFGQCELTRLQLPASLTALASNVFGDSFSLISVTLPEGLRSIGYYAFGNCNNMESVLIPASVTSIANEAFSGISTDQLTVYCYHNTEAETFALNQGYAIVYLDGEAVLEGFSVVPVETEVSLGLNHQLENVDELFTILPENAPYQANLVLATGDESIASVQDNVLTGLTVGETELVACLEENSNISASIKVYIRENITDFTLPAEIWQPMDETLTLLPATTVPEGANDGYKWTVDQAIADIEGNVLTPAAAGNATLTATSWNGVVRTAILHVYDEPTAVTFKNVPAGADVNTQITLEPHVMAGTEFTGDLANHFLTYSSSDETIATVDAEGVVTTLDYGTAVITAKTENGVEGQAAIYVSAPITSFNLQGRILAPVGATIDLAATEVEPANANPNAFTWTCNPEGLVSYANGKVTVLTDQEAEVTITATSWDGALSKTTAMTIYRPQVESITFEPMDWVEPDTYVQLTAHVKAVNDFVNQLIRWELEDDNEWSGSFIDQNGLLYTGSYGWSNQLKVTATADNGISESIYVTVVYPTGDFKVDERIILQTGASKEVQPTEVKNESGSTLDRSYWKFSLSAANETLADVDGMFLAGVKPGQTDVTVRSWNGSERVMKLLVYDPIEEIEVWVDEDQLPNALYPTDLMVQKNYNMHSLAASDREYEDDLLIWSSSDPTVIRVEDEETGLIRTVNYGTATLTATAENGVSQSIELTVRKEVDTFLMPVSIQAHVLADQELAVASITPADAWDGFVWRVEPQTLGTIEGNILHVTADQPTTGRLIATSWDGYVTKDTLLQIIQEPVTEITIDPVSRIGADSDVQLTAHVLAGVEYINRFVTFSSSNDAVATVDADGVVHAHAPGKVTITVAAEPMMNGEETEDEGAEEAATVSAEIEIEVIRGVSSFALTEKVYLQAGDQMEVTLENVLPEDALCEFTWESGKEDALTVEADNETAVLKSIGEITEEVDVTVTSWNGTRHVMTVSVYEPVTEIVLSGMPEGVAPGSVITLDAEVTAGGSFGKELLTFSSSDETVATVDENGVVEAVGYGRAIITAKAVNGEEASVTCRVTVPVEDFALPVRFLAAAGTSIELSVNDIEPANADAEAIIWSIEPAELGTLEGNVFTAAMVDDLTGTVTATGWDGQVVKQAVLQVYKPQVTDIVFDEVPTLWNGAQYQLQAHVFADGTEFINELVTFTTNNSNYTVDENGLLICPSYTYNDWVRVTATAENGVSAWVDIWVATKVEDFTLEQNVLMQKGSTYQINVTECQGSSQPYTYTADDSGVVTVNQFGMVSAVKAGEATVTVKAFSGLEKTVTVRVHEPVVSITIDPVEENQRMITNVPLNVHVMAEKEYGDELITWTTSNGRVASVSSEGLVKTLSYGEVTITATAENGVSASVFIRVAKEVTSFTLPEEFVGYVEHEVELSASSISPEDAHATFDWTVTPAEIGTVKNNVLTILAKEPCEGTLTAVSWDGNVTREAAIRILKEEVSALVLDMPEDEIVTDQDVQLVARVTAGAEYENKFVTWSVSDETVATVDENGLLHPVAAGEVTVTVTTENGLTDEITLTVHQGVSSFDVPESIRVYVGETAELNITNILPENAEDRPFEITVEPEGLVSIEDGVITPLVDRNSEGTITVTSWNGISRTIALTVKVPVVESITIEPLPRLYSGKEFQLKATVVVDGETYVNRFVTFESYVYGSYLEEHGYGTLDEMTGDVKLYKAYGGYNISFDVRYRVASGDSYTYASEQMSGTVEYALNDFHIIPLPEVLRCGETVELDITDVDSYDPSASREVTWTAEPADAVSIDENGVMTVLTKEETDVTLTATAWCDLVRTASFRICKVDDVESFTLPARMLVPIGGTTRLTMTSLVPEDAGMQNFTFTMEPEGLAKIEDGMITPLTNSETTIKLTVTSWNGLTQTTTLQLYAPNVTKIEVQPISLWSNEIFQLHAKVWVDGVEYEDQFVTWKALVDDGYDISDWGWGSVTDDGELEIYSSGNFDVTLVAVADNGVTGELNQYVHYAYRLLEVPEVTLIRENESIEFTVSNWEGSSEPYYYNGNDNASVYFTLGDESIVSLNDRYSGEYVYLTALQKGETTITAHSRNGVTATGRLIVYDEVDTVEVAPVGPQQIYKNIQMTATVTTDGISVDNQLVTWSSSDESIATVNQQGMVRTVGYGTATITATADNGISHSTDVVIYEDTLSFTVPGGTVSYGDTLELYVDEFMPEGGLNQMTWTVEPADAATIEGNVLKPLKNEEMQLTVTATSWDGVSFCGTVTVQTSERPQVMYLPGALTVIEEEAFANTFFAAVGLPATCTTIESRAFADSQQLKEVHLGSSVISIATDAFAGSENVTIYAPEGSYAQQFAADNGIPFVAE